MEIETLKQQPVDFFNFKKVQQNLISDLKYYSFEDRVFDLSTLFVSKLNERMTEIIGSKTYMNVAKNYKGNGVNENHLIFNGVYKLAPLDGYFGFIPEKNQIEIKEKIEKLKNNPFLKQNFELVILAPLNNFATENNIKAIDPIAFAYFKEGEHCYEKNYLITLSQWI